MVFPPEAFLLSRLPTLGQASLQSAAAW